MWRWGILIISWFSGANAAAQSTYTSFATNDLTPSVYQQGLGGQHAAGANREVLQLFSNPALIGDTLAGQVALSYTAYLGGIGQSAAAYAHQLGPVTGFAGIAHLNYGRIKTYDDTGLETGEFTAGETSIHIGASRTQGVFQFGSSLRWTRVNLGTQASAMLLNFGAHYRKPDGLFDAGVVVANVGWYLQRFAGTSSRLGPEVRLGVRFKPEQMPLRFSFTLTRLGRQEIESRTLPAAVLHKLTLGAEILLHPAFSILTGWQFRRDTSPGSGLSYGMEIRLRSFQVAVSGIVFASGRSTLGFGLYKNLVK